MALWPYEATKNQTGRQLVNDSKTPSGYAHVGALRGVVMHDALYRALLTNGLEARYTFGSDDYDPLDEIPFGMDELYTPHLGQPLCNVPAPPDSPATDLADHFISQFFGLFEPLGVRAETYRMRDVYRRGDFDDAIRTVLDHGEIITKIYLDRTGSVKPEDWFALQVVCENCGRIGTTLVTEWDGDTVAYSCEPDLVAWATGCGHRGRISPFGGNAKLPWKLEWAAKWKVFGVTVEGAGKDHNTRGGSRDVSDAVARQVFGIEPPLNVPYEFFLIGGAKMSSSRGLGATAAEIVELLPAEVLRFLLVNTRPKKALNFTPDLDTINRLFNGVDQLAARRAAGTLREIDTELLPIISVDDNELHTSPTPRVGEQLPWETVVNLIQIPHVDFWDQVARRFDPPITNVERAAIEMRIHTAQLWLERYAPADQVLKLTDEVSPLAQSFTDDQRRFLGELAAAFEKIEWEADPIQAAIFDATRSTPIEPAPGFSALYVTFLGRESGPKAGPFLSFLDRAFVLDRLNATLAVA
jgi:lysyl-tRNA synthetase class 1